MKGSSPRAKLIAGIMYLEKGEYDRAVKGLKAEFSAIEAESETFSFDFTDYYSREMGPGLRKRFLCFKEPVERDRLMDIKAFTNALEARRSVKGKRRVNIDPGYVTRDNLIMASTKERGHRIYLGGGIYAEVTLIFRKQKCETLPWTYPDYRTNLARDFFLGVRKSL
jgi:hypothetical protein